MRGAADTSDHFLGARLCSTHLMGFNSLTVYGKPKSWYSYYLRFAYGEADIESECVTE